MLREVEHPIFTNLNENISVIKRNSHLVLDFSFHSNSMYKHTILTDDLSKQERHRREPVRVVIRDSYLCRYEHLYKALPQYRDCLSLLFTPELLGSGCPVNVLVNIRTYVQATGCLGIVGPMGDILLYSERGVTSLVRYQIRYRPQGGTLQMIEDLLNRHNFTGL